MANDVKAPHLGIPPTTDDGVISKLLSGHSGVHHISADHR